MKKNPVKIALQAGKLQGRHLAVMRQRAGHSFDGPRGFPMVDGRPGTFAHRLE